MKLQQPDALARHLCQKRLLPVYLISGDEPFLVQEAKQTILKAAKAGGFSVHERLEANGTSFDWSTLTTAAQHLSLFSDKTLLDLRLPTPKPGIQGSKQLVAYAKHLPDDKLLVITTGKFESNTHQAAWVKAIDKVGAVITLWPVISQQFPTWLKVRLADAKLCLSEQALASLAYHTEGNLLAATQTIERLQLLYGQSTSRIDETMLQAALTDSARFDVYQLIETALVGNLPKALRILSSLQAEAVPPTLVLWAITRELRRLAELAQAVQQGQPLSRLFQTQRIWSKQQPIIRAALKHHPKMSYWLSMIKQAQLVDCLIKGAAEQTNCWLAMERLLAGVACQLPAGSAV